MTLLAGNRNSTEICLYKVLKEHNESYSGELSQQALISSQFTAMGNYFKNNAILSLMNLTTFVTVPGLFTNFTLNFTPFVANSKTEAHEKFALSFANSLSGVQVNGISFALGTQVMNLVVTGPEYEDCLEQISESYINWCKSLQLNPATNFSVVSII